MINKVFHDPPNFLIDNATNSVSLETIKQPKIHGTATPFYGAVRALFELKWPVPPVQRHSINRSLGTRPQLMVEKYHADLIQVTTRISMPNPYYMELDDDRVRLAGGIVSAAKALCCARHWSWRDGSFILLLHMDDRPVARRRIDADTRDNSRVSRVCCV